MTGYIQRAYAESLAEFGTPHLLPRSGGWILKRQIEGWPDRDGMGCYPLFACLDWSGLRADLDHLSRELVSVALVTDPFGDYDAGYLSSCFHDLVMPFKRHFVVDLSQPIETFVHSHHRRNARKALREIQVEHCANPVDFLDDWIALYGMLIERHAIRGVAAFSRESFARQLVVPGIVAFRAVHNDTTVGMLLWYKQGRRAYYHLGTYNPCGYELGASFALFDFSLRYFADDGLEWLNLGAGAGAGTSGESGLDRFKEGWSNGIRTAYFCGRIFDQKKYQEIVLAKNVPPTEYFPAYRLGEFD